MSYVDMLLFLPDYLRFYYYLFDQKYYWPGYKYFCFDWFAYKDYDLKRWDMAYSDDYEHLNWQKEKMMMHSGRKDCGRFID